MKITPIGIDIGKTTFHMVGLDLHGSIVIRRKFSRKALLPYTANLPSSLIGIEACGGAHCLARVLREQGHQSRLIPGQFVKPYRKSNKNDYLDAEAIAEAVTRQNMRFVPIKTDDQLDLQGLHRVRERLVHNRTEIINQIRGFLLERGITFNRGPMSLRKEMPLLLEDAEQNLTPKLTHAARSPVARVAAPGQLGRPDRRRNGCRGQRRCRLSAFAKDPRRRAAGFDGNGCCCGKRGSLQAGSRLRRMAGTSAEATFDRRQSQAAGHHQAWQPLSAHDVRARGSGGAVAGEIRHRRSRSMGASTGGTSTTQQSHRSHRQ